MRQWRISTLVENTASLSLLGEHGLAFWLETPAGAILLDTGQGEVLFRNARHMGIDLATAEALVLSHGHYDHTGAVAAVLKMAQQARVYLHPEALSPKFARRPDGMGRSIGMPDSSRLAIQDHPNRIVAVTSPARVLDEVYLTGPIPRKSSFEDTGGDFYCDEACSHRDSLMDDQAVFFQTSQGTVVVVGCAHSGVVNILTYVRDLTHGKPIYTVIGGMHLLAATEDRLSRTIASLRELDVPRIGLAHCTGFAAMARLQQELPGRCFHCAAGTRLDFDG